jgi:hypothetical protein
MAEKIVIAGSLAQRPNVGGHAWVFLQYLLGFRRLGFDVLFVDALEEDMLVDASGRRCGLEESVNVSYLTGVMEQFELSSSFALIGDGGGTFIGRSRTEVIEHAKDSVCLLNVMGFLEDEEVLGSARKRAFLDIDPGLGQLWCELGLHDAFAGHDLFVTIGEKIGGPDARVPDCGLEWITTPQPVVLERWPPAPPAGGRFTTIATWRGSYGPIEYEGRTYGLRVHEFRKFVRLPRLTDAEFELALDIHPDEVNDLRLLDENGWSLVDPTAVAGDPRAYRSYIERSRAEFMVAKSLYVEGNTGWFSDRSICYLATGRPVLAQDTGFASIYPTGEGLFAFSTIEQAAAAVEEILRDYPRHALAARAIAESHFDSDKVLGNLVERLGA